MEIKTDVVIVGTGVGGAFSALNLPEDKQILMITKSDLESSDSFLAQGGICVLRDYIHHIIHGTNVGNGVLAFLHAECTAL